MPTFAGWNSSVGVPVSSFPGELLKAYPDAKFVLTVRNTKEWYTSIQNSICILGGHENWFASVLLGIPVFPFTRLKEQVSMLDALVKNKFAVRSILRRYILAAGESAIKC